jgi:beta-galactosidase/beta-glucuronidase
MPTLSEKTDSLKITTVDDNVKIAGKHFSVTFSESKGALISFKNKDREMLKSPLVPNFWRAPTDNDSGPNAGGSKMPQRLGIWKVRHLEGCRYQWKSRFFQCRKTIKRYRKSQSSLGFGCKRQRFRKYLYSF